MRPHHPTHLRMSLWDCLVSSPRPLDFIKSLNYDDSIDLLSVCYYMEHDDFIASVESHLRSLFD